MTSTAVSTTSPLMDAFWSLSSPNPQLRAQASNKMITSLFPTSSDSDKQYAFNRLFKGLNSGRASARQGYAGALAMLLRKFKEEEGEGWRPDLEEIYTTLKTSTSPPTTTKKGSESRDYIFGTLFGLLSIARSSILSDGGSSAVLPFLDLATNLYSTKKWLRETAVHAITELLNSTLPSTKNELINSTVKPFIEENASTPETIYLKLSLGLEEVTEKMLKAETQNFISTSSTYPRLHILWPQLLSKSLLNPSTLKYLFTSIISPTMTLSTMERKSQVLNILMYLCEQEVGEEEVEFIFDGRVGKLLLNCVNGDTKNAHTLKNLGLDTLKKIKESAEKRSPSFKFKLATSLLLIDTRFDSKTRFDLVSTLLSSLDSTSRKEYLEFLKSQILEESKKEGDEEFMGKVKNKVEAFSDLMLNAAKVFSQETTNNGTTTEPTSPSASPSLNPPSQEVMDALGFFMAFSFFDCSNVKVAEESLPPPPQKKGKKGKKTKAPAATPPTTNPATAAALKLKSSAPHSLRQLTASRFFSLLSLLTSPSYPLGVSTATYRSTHAMWVALESSNCPLHRHALTEEVMSSRVVTSSISQLSLKEPKAQALANLTMCLSIQILNEGSSGGLSALDDEDNLDDAVVDIINDLCSGYSKVIGVKVEGLEEEEEDDEQDPVAVVADVCVAILGMGGGGSSRGASVRMLRESVKRCWAGVLQEVEGLKEPVVKVLIEGVCGELEDEDEDGEEDGMEEEEEEDGMDVEENEGIFQKFAEMDEKNDDDDEAAEDEEEANSDSDDDTDDDDDDESSVELDADALNKMLLGSDDEGDDMGDEDELQHHSGADGALAAMLKATQQTRKKGTMQREQMAVDHKQRCMGLLETALNKNKVGVGLYDLLVPLLVCRRELVNQSQGVSKSAAAVGVAKKQLADKIQKLFVSKICKMKAPKDGEGGEKLLKCFGLLAKEGKRSYDSVHSGAVGLAMAMCLRHSGAKGIEGEKDVYSSLISDWSTNKKSKVHSNLFEEVLTRLGDDGFKRGTGLLLEALAEAVSGGRNDYVKAEAFRIAAKIYGDDKAEVGGVWKTSLKGLCGGVNESLGGDGFKAKRVKEVVMFCAGAVKWGAKGGNWEVMLDGCGKGLERVIAESKSDGVVKSAKASYATISEGVEKEKKGSSNGGGGEKKGKKKKGKK